MMANIRRITDARRKAGWRVAKDTPISHRRASGQGTQRQSTAIDLYAFIRAICATNRKPAVARADIDDRPKRRTMSARDLPKQVHDIRWCGYLGLPQVIASLWPL